MYKTAQFWLEIQFNLLSYPVFQIFRTVFIFLIYSSQWSQEQAKHQIWPSNPLLLVLQDAPIGLNLHLQGELDLNQLLVLLLPCNRIFCVSQNSHTHTNECNVGFISIFLEWCSIIIIQSPQQTTFLDLLQKESNLAVLRAHLKQDSSMLGRQKHVRKKCPKFFLQG